MTKCNCFKLVFKEKCDVLKGLKTVENQKASASVLSVLIFLKLCQKFNSLSVVLMFIWNDHFHPLPISLKQVFIFVSCS